MIHYHGTPITPDAAAASILAGRHAMVSFAQPDQIDLVALVCQSFVFDNGAFTFWKRKKGAIDCDRYYAFVEQWRRHPGFDWALIPDVIDGDEAENDRLVQTWPFDSSLGVPVWHLHESLERLERLVTTWPRVALGSSAEYSRVGTQIWFRRMADAMARICVNGRPAAKLHGLRMLDPRVFSAFPFSSADSTNIARNIGIDQKWKGTYLPPTKAARGLIMASRIEHRQSADRWPAHDVSDSNFELFSTEQPA